MTTADNTVIQALTALIDEVESLARFEPGDLGGGDYWTIDDKREARRLHVRCLSAIDRYAPPDSAYRRQAASMEGDPSWVAELASVLTALRDDYRDGVMRPFTELVHAAVFDDFLEMAAELDGKQFHAPAAVLAGSVLEEHLRKLADKAGIAVHDDRGRAKSVEALGVGLVKSGTISERRRKIIAGWYGQRTEGAHGHFDKVVAAEVPRMIEGIRDFIVEHPA